MPPPQPGPSPTPSPKPCGAIQIGTLDMLGGGGATITPSIDIGIPPFEVSKDYVETCHPEVGGFYVVFEDVTCFISDEDFAEHFE